jgi:hypothetical protein
MKIYMEVLENGKLVEKEIEGTTIVLETEDGAKFRIKDGDKYNLEISEHTCRTIVIHPRVANTIELEARDIS